MPQREHSQARVGCLPGKGRGLAAAATHPLVARARPGWALQSKMHCRTEDGGRGVQPGAMRCLKQPRCATQLRQARPEAHAQEWVLSFCTPTLPSLSGV